MYLCLPSMFHLLLSALCHGSEYFEDTYMERPERSLSDLLGARITHFEKIAEGMLYEGSSPNNYPVQYGTVIKYPAYYPVFLIWNSGGDHLWMAPAGNGPWTQIK